MNESDYTVEHIIDRMGSDQFDWFHHQTKVLKRSVLFAADIFVRKHDLANGNWIQAKEGFWMTSDPEQTLIASSINLREALRRENPSLSDEEIVALIIEELPRRPGLELSP